jgi:hypothetical protein
VCFKKHTKDKRLCNFIKQELREDRQIKLTLKNLSIEEDSRTYWVQQLQAHIFNYFKLKKD